MNNSQGISIAVLTTDQDDVELINRTLRDAGQTAHCHWIAQSNEFDDIMSSSRLELIIQHGDKYPDSIRQVVKQKHAYIPEVPVIAIQARVDEAQILKAMKDGASDLVSINHIDRLQAVVSRELRAFRVERALNSTLVSASEYRRQLNDYMQNASTAIANVQDGIITDVNQAWLKLFKVNSIADSVGQPLMDLFESESLAAIKGAIIATTKGK